MTGMADRCRHLVIHTTPGIPGLEWLGFIPKTSHSCELDLMGRDGVNPWRPCEGCPEFEAGEPMEVEDE